MFRTELFHVLQPAVLAVRLPGFRMTLDPDRERSEFVSAESHAGQGYPR